MLLAAASARASTATYLFDGRPLALTHVSHAAGAAAVGINDPGLRSLVRSLGAVITWHPGERYVLITTGAAQVISFSVGDRGYDVGPLSATAEFAPYLVGSEVYLPLADLLRSLSLAPRSDGNATVLQREITSIDVRGSAQQAILVARGAGSLSPRVASESGDTIVYAFDGFGSTLEGSRPVDAGGVRSMQVRVTGSVRNPRTLVTLTLQPGTRHDPPRSNDGDFEVAFGGGGSAPPLLAGGASAPVAAAPVATMTPVAEPTPPFASASPPDGTNASAAPAGTTIATVGGVSVQNGSDGATVTIPVVGNAQFAWHRLRAPDNRFWIDVQNAHLADGPLDQPEPDPLISVRVRQIDPQTVRVALSVAGSKNISVSPSATGIAISVGTQEVADGPHFGSGSVGTLVSSNEPQALVTPVPPDEYGQNDAGATWKFGPHSTYVPTRPKLIVIDPGHGGGDVGTTRNGVTEASLTLDMAKRLQAILVARGWQVQLTRETDVDVKRTTQSAQEAISDGYRSTDAQDLQARDDIANNAGARLFVSIHVNSFINSGPSGTTTYFSKPDDVPLAQAVQHDLAATLGTKDDGTIKSKLYVTLHANMPAVLVETAFLSNPDDYAKLNSADWRQRVAESIADGIDQYAKQYPVPSANQ
ncbi:MAG: N-acetylmuramoyl-L-alanine amidase [bacterium]|nr:N-acetylmuramoyl-L-alanine amidase [bacterium]